MVTISENTIVDECKEPHCQIIFATGDLIILIIIFTVMGAFGYYRLEHCSTIHIYGLADRIEYNRTIVNSR